jgi:hypothetical protein
LRIDAARDDSKAIAEIYPLVTAIPLKNKLPGKSIDQT